MMMMAGGCGSAAAGVNAAARGRFPGRPWASRSRLRSERRGQLGRCGAEELSGGVSGPGAEGGGPRPVCPPLACAEDQRLLGIEASYNNLGEAGYSSSGSEEGSEFRGFEAENERNNIPGQTRRNPHKRNRAPTKSTKRGRHRAAPADVRKGQTLENNSRSTQKLQNTESATVVSPEDGGLVTDKLLKPRLKRDSVKEVPLAPRITIKLVTKKRVKVDNLSHQKSEGRQKRNKVQPEDKETQCTVGTCARVKLKSTAPATDITSEIKEQVSTRRRGRSADKKVECTSHTVPEMEKSDQKVEVKLRKSARKSQSAPCSDTVEPKTEEKKAEPTGSALKENTEVKKLVIRRRHRKDSSHVQETGDHKKEDSLAESLLEVSMIEEPVPLSKKKKGKKKKRHRKGKVSEKVREKCDLLTEQPVGDSAEMQSIENEFVGIPGLKLTRIRNPKARSRKKRSKFIWTLTLVKCKSKSITPQENLSKAPDDLCKDTESPSKCAEMEDVPTEPEDSSGVAETSEIPNTPQISENKLPTADVISETSENPDTIKTDEDTPKSVEKLAERSEVAKEINPNKDSLTDLDNIINKDIISPRQRKVVRSPKKCNSSKQPHSFQHKSDTFELKDISSEPDDHQSSADSPESQLKITALPAPKLKPRLNQNTARKKRARHKLWSVQKRKPKITPSDVNRDSDITDEILACETEHKSDELPCEQPKPRKSSIKDALSRLSPRKPPLTVPAPEEPQSCEAPLPEATEPISIESAAIQPHPVSETEPELNPEEKLLTEEAEVLVLEPPLADEAQPPQPVQKSLKQAKRKRRALIGQRFRPRRYKLLPRSIKEAGTCMPVGASEPSKPKLIGILKAKYKKQQVSARLSQSLEVQRSKASFVAQQEENDPVLQKISQEENESVNEKLDLDSTDVQPGKTKFVKNIKHFIMPVVTARSSRVIKTPKRFMDDADMSDLPRRNSQKKGHLSGGLLKVKKRDGSEKGEPNSFQQPDEEDLPETPLDLDFLSSEESKDDTTEDNKTLGEEKFPGKRRSLLRNPSFNWKVLDPVGGELYNFDQDIEKDLKMLSAKDFSLDSLIDPSQKKKSVKKQPLNTKADKRLIDKLNYGLNSKSQSKVLPSEKEKESHPDEVQTAELEEETSLSPSLSEIEREKAKLKIEDLDTPGVVRKVSICMRALSSKLLAQQQEEQVEEMPDEFSIHTDISLPTRCMDIERMILDETRDKKLEGSLDQKTSADAFGSEERVASNRPSLSGANKHMLNLLKKAKVQLIKIDQQKQLKSSGLLKEGGIPVARRERRKPKECLQNASPSKSDRNEKTDKTDVSPEPAPEGEGRGGPRIKHVCRAAAVVLGQPRAVVPDDIPRLSALPLHERSGISPSPADKDIESHSDPESPILHDQRVPKFRRVGRVGMFGFRSRRCGECKGCLHEEDCGRCINCLDKPKFGGPNTKRQCCVFKRCDHIEERKAKRLSGKLYKGHTKRRRSSISVGHSSNEDGEGLDGTGRSSPMSVGDSQSPSLRKQPRRHVKPRSYCDLLDYESDLDITGIPHSTSPARRRVPGPRNADFVSLDDFDGEDLDEGIRHRRSVLSKVSAIRRKPEKSPQEQTPPSVLAALANGFAQREMEPSEPSFKICIDFKEDCNLQSVWSSRGLSILTSVPLMPQYACLLCASKGQHEMLHCQVCCEPFHYFCLDPSERPQEENKENWCCRHCKFCRVCGRKDKLSKPLLECERCQNCYHPACLGPNYPKPNKRKKAWVCMTCIRCKSCGVTPGKTWDTEWDHDKGFCPDCTRLYDQGNYCTMCFKCYEDNDYESQMMQCSTCNHWVHAKCEGLTEDLYEILSSLPESVVYLCQPCTKADPVKVQETDSAGGWRQLLMLELRAGVEKVLACLLSSTLTQHLVTCKECTSLCDPEDGDDEDDILPICDFRAVGKKFDKGLYTTLKSFHEDVVGVIRRKLEEEESLPEDQRPTALARSYYLKLMEEVFSWFNSQDPKVWDPRSKHLPIGMLLHAVLPPTNEHVYAQWKERDEKSPIVNNSKEQRLRGHSDVKGEDLVDCSTPLSHRSVNSQYRDMASLRHGLKGKKGRSSKSDLDADWSKEDDRQCVLCQKYGDAKSSDAGRLLYLGQNEWAHVNCSMWSAEVFEEDNGCLMHVHSAVARGRLMRCERCNKTGATVGCCLTSCQSNYHFMCARYRNCVFQDDKRVFCYKHRDLISGQIITGQGFEVLRRVYVDSEGISLRRKFLTGLEPDSINMMIGSLQVSNLGKLNELSAKQGKLFPVGYECSRFYWSTVNPRRRSKYTCRIMEVRPPVQENPVEELSDQGENCTIAHSECLQSESGNTEGNVTPANPSSVSPFPKPDAGTRPKMSIYPKNRRPTGGLSRPLPSPGAAPSKPHHILTISDLDDSCRPRRHSPHSQNTGIRGHMSCPTLGSPGGSVNLRAGGSHLSKSTQPTSPSFPLGATENLLTSSSARSVGRSASFARGSGILAPHSTSGLFSQPMWQGGTGSTPSSSRSLSSPTQLSTRPRLPFELHQLDSAELPHNFLASPQELPAENGSSPLGDTMDPQIGSHLVTSKEFPYTPFHLGSDLSVVPHLKNELEIEETVVNEGVAMNCSEQIVVEGVENQEEFWDQEAKLSSQRLRHPTDTHTEDWDNSSSDEDMGNYFSFARTTVNCRTSRAKSQKNSSAVRSISQLDGVDDGTESDASVTSSNNQNMKNQSQIQKPSQSIDVLHHKQWTSNGLCVDLPNAQLQTPSKPFDLISSVGNSNQMFSSQSHVNESEVNKPEASLNSIKEGFQDTCQNTDFIGPTFPSASVSPTKEALSNFAVPKQTATKYSSTISDDLQSSKLSTDSGRLVVVEKCDSPSPRPCFTKLVTVQEDPQVDTQGTTECKEIYLDHKSGHFVSATDGSTVGSNNVLEATSEHSVLHPVNGSQDPVQKIVQPVFQTSETISPAVSVLSLQSSSSLQHSLSSYSKGAHSSNITLYPVQAPERKTVLPPMESFRTKLPSDTSRHAPSVPSGAVPYVSADLPPKPESVLAAPSGTGVPLASLGPVLGSVSTPVYPTFTQPVGSTVSIVPPTISQPSAQCQTVPPIIQTASCPVVVNGYNSMPMQREAASGRTISINFSTPRQTVEPQQQMTQALPGHAILTVKEVGGPNVDPTPHVLLVNRLGQIFVKNPESNTFQLPSPNSPSYNCVTQIASLLQSNALSATLAAAGNLSGVAAATMPAQVPRIVTPVNPQSDTITQLLTASNNGTAAPQEVKLSNQNASASGNVPEKKKQQKKKEPQTPRKNKSPATSGPSSKAADNHADSAQAIINQAMASYYDPSRSCAHILNPSSQLNSNTGGRAQTLSSVVIPPGLLVEPESITSSPATPHSSRPKQVRMKRVSSLSDRIATKKSKSDFVEPELCSGLEDQRKLNLAASRCWGVRIKTPTVKGVLDLDKLNEEPSSDTESAKTEPWDRLSVFRGGDNNKPQAWDATRRSSLSDWNKYSGMMSCSEDEMTPSDSEDQFPSRGDQPHLRFEITSDDGFIVEADSIEVAWRAVIDGVQEARAAYKLRQLSFTGMNGARMMGLMHDAVVYLVEQLQGAKCCYRHTFRFHKQASQEEDLPINPSGCARSEVYLRKSTFDMFNFLASQHRQLPDVDLYDEEEDDVLLKSSRRATSLELPMAMRFRHLEKTSKEAVGVYRSAIHGRGLFCKRNIEAGEMVIEYSGIVIRSVLTDKREKYYDGKGIGCYMFRIDDFEVVDATMHGNAARFINHSCEPNCYSRVINVEGQKHIVIFALRKIYRGEELTYDYKFPIEDASNKLSCNCGAKRCRRFLN
ncbi:histone-lysine N-methyltransferase 2B [Hoplias malabaricus]|uniref:histone-lysine N-methyltransferase 2B n=1 Tax=Hoplias malabaricus TaxID=27720 RepID=UPI0034629461